MTLAPAEMAGDAARLGACVPGGRRPALTRQQRQLATRAVALRAVTGEDWCYRVYLRHHGAAQQIVPGSP